MAQYTVYNQAGGNWDDASAWNDDSGGEGAFFTDPQNGVNTFICDLNAQVVTVNTTIAVDQIVFSSGSLTLVDTGSRNPNLRGNMQ